MPTCCKVESKVNKVWESGTVEYICPVCGKVYAMAEMGNVFNMPPKWKIGLRDERRGVE